MSPTLAPSLIATPFGPTSTAMEVIDGVDLSGRRALVTGGSSGTGIETARALASAGADVTITVRNLTAGREIVAALVASTGSAHVHVAPLDLADRSSIDRFVAGWDRPLDILINNAGVMQIPQLTLTSTGHEMHFAENHLGHFTLALGLHDALARAGDARIVSVSSVGHLRSPVVFDDINFASRPYEPRLAYGQSKTANVLFAVEATRRWGADGITANALHPGSTVETDASRHMDPDERAALVGWAWDTYFPKTPQQGAATSVLLATSPQLERIGARYFEDCNEAAVVDVPDPSNPPSSGVASYAIDPVSADRLWQLSSSLLGL